MISLPQLLATAEHMETGIRSEVPPNWLQGRTAYGGLSSALALTAAKQIEPDLPPLRSAQVAFVGPLSGAVTATATKLRRGRNAAFIQSDVVSAAGVGLRTNFVFMSRIESAIDHDTTTPTRHLPPAADAALETGPEGFFTCNFNYLDLHAECGPAQWLRWVRLIDRDGLDPAVELMAVADSLPPATARLLPKATPLSSLTWQINILEPAPTSRDGWWLLGAETDSARNGYSSQTMRMWNSDGTLVAEGTQSVAFFG